MSECNGRRVITLFLSFWIQGVTFAGIIHLITDDESESKICIDNMGKIISCNKPLLKMFGYTNTEVIGKNIKMLMPFKYAQHHDEYLKSFREGGECDFTFPFTIFVHVFLHDLFSPSLHSEW